MVSSKLAVLACLAITACGQGAIEQQPGNGDAGTTDGGDAAPLPDGSSCQAADCAELGHECGIWDDGCGGELDCGPCQAEGVTDSLSQHGITWHFAAEVPYGRFVTGDYWVQGPITVTAVEPGATSSNGWQLNGSMLNPPNGRQAYDSRTTHWNVGYHEDYRAHFPLDIEPDASLVSTISREPFDEPLRPALQTAAVLTVLSEPPRPGSFRPGLIGEDKYMFNYHDIRWDRLPGLAVTASAPDPIALAGRFERPWLLHGAGWTHRHIMPLENSPSYHQDVARLLSHAAVVLSSDIADIEELVVNYLQVAIDYYTMQQSPGEGAYNYFWPIVFAGIMFDRADMRSMWTQGSHNSPEYHQHKVYFGSIRSQGSAVFGEEGILSRTGVLLGGPSSFDEQDTWTGYYARTGERPVFYSPGTGDTDGHEELHPSEWDALQQNAPNTYKRMHSVSMVGFSFASWAFEALDSVHIEAYVPYTIRWMYEDESIIHDSYGPTGGAHPYATSRSDFVDEMWHTHWNF